MDEHGNDLLDVARAMTELHSKEEAALSSAAASTWENVALLQQRGAVGRVREPNVSVLSAKANLLWHQHHVSAAYAEARRAYDSEPLNDTVLPVLIASMVELKLKPELFKCAHKVSPPLARIQHAFFVPPAGHLLTSVSTQMPTSWAIWEHYFKLACRSIPA